MKIKLTAALLLVLLLLASCDGGEVAGDLPSASPLDSASSAPAPLQHRNQLFGLPWQRTETFNPITETSGVNINLNNLIYEGLFAVGPDFEPEPLLCESYSQNGRVFTFKLRPGVTFHDGSALTAADVISSLKSALLPQTIYSARMSAIDSYRAVDELTIEISTVRPMSRLPCLLDFPVIKGAGTSGGFPPGTGPYAPVFGEDENYLRHFQAYRSKVPIERIDLITQTSAEGIIHSIESGSVDVVATDETGTEPITIRGDIERRDFPTSTMQYLIFNTRNSWLGNQTIRQAVFYAIDRAGIVRMMSGHTVEATLPAPPASKIYDKAVAAKYNFNQELSRQLLASAGFADKDSDGILDYAVSSRRFKPFKLTVIVNAENPYKVNAAEMAVQQLRNVGVDAELSKLKWDVYVRDIQTGNFQMAYAETRLTADLSPFSLVCPGGALNYGKASDAELNQAVAEFEAAAAGEISEKASAMFDKIGAKAVIVPILFKNNTFNTLSGVIKNATPSQGSLFFGFEKWTITK